MTSPHPPHASSRPIYDELPDSEEMQSDARAASEHLRLERAARTAVGRAAPSLRYEDQPPEAPKTEIRIDEATARLAAALHLHLD